MGRQQHRILNMLLIALLLAAVVSTWPLHSAFAQDNMTRTLTIFDAECPAGYMGSASADECDNSPAAGVLFRIGRPFTEAFTDFVPTDNDGLVTFGFGDASWLNGTLRVIEQLPTGTASFVAYCVDETGNSLRITYPAVGDFNLGVADIGAGKSGNVACDWYNVPESSRPSVRTVDQRTSGVQMEEQPSWWVVPFAPGYGNTNEGHLYFGVHVENPTNATVNVGVSYRAYQADGTPFPGCTAPFGDGAGVSTTIAPGETAFLTCTRTVSPRTLSGLQVTARLWDIQPLPSSPESFNVANAQFATIPEQSTPMETTYTASALVRPVGNQDATVAVLFRFYDGRGVQVGTCDSNYVTIEPEVAQRVDCSFPLTLDTTSPQPVRVRVEPLPIRP